MMVVPAPSPWLISSPPFAAQDLRDLRMQHRVRAYRVRTVDRRLTRPRREMSAGFGQDWQEWRAVPWIHRCVEHDLRAAGGDENVAVTIAPGAVQFRIGDKPIVRI